MFITFAIILGLLQIFIPRSYGFLPLLIAALHTGRAELIPYFTVLRLVIVIALARALIGGFFHRPRIGSADRPMILFSLIIITSACFHSYETGNPYIIRLGLVINILGTYWIIRSYIPDYSSIERYVNIIPFLLIPLAFFLLEEKLTGNNAYFELGARRDTALERLGNLRAQGPFSHAILAGTCGATFLPLLWPLWKTKASRAAIGTISCLIIVYASSSSGPIAAMAAGMAGIALWRYRIHLKKLIIAGCCAAVVIQLLMSKPIWFLIARIDLVGGSTGWHRAELIDQSLRHLREWWLMGTDYTRHWMPTGVTYSENHTDLTNYIIHLGVLSGIFVPGVLLWTTYKLIRQSINTILANETAITTTFLIWCCIVSLLTHLISFVSISYFDQMLVPFYALIAIITTINEGTNILSEPTLQAFKNKESQRELLTK